MTNRYSRRRGAPKSSSKGNQRATPGHFSLVRGEGDDEACIELMPSGRSDQFDAAKKRAQELGNLYVYDPRGSYITGPKIFSPRAERTSSKPTSRQNSRW